MQLPDSALTSVLVGHSGSGAALVCGQDDLR
jgi:hypothetical protein